MNRKVCCLFILLFICSAFPSLIHADNQTVFGPKSFEIGNWHIHASVQKFNVEDPGEGFVTITKNTPDKSINGGFILFNTTVVPLQNFLTGDEMVFEKEITLRSINFITVFLRGTPGASVTITINAGGIPFQPPVVSFSSDPETITLGESSSLSWDVIDADSISIDSGIGTVDPSGSSEVFPTESTTYTLTAIGPGGTTTESVTVSVNIPVPIVSISSNPETILLGESSILTWSTSHAETCTIEPGIGSVDVNGSISVSPMETTTYTITLTGPGGTSSAEVTITVTDPNAPPTVIMAPASDIISQGESINLTWNSDRAQNAFIDNGVGSVPVNGSTTVSPDNTTTYTITVTGPTGSNSAQAKIQVIGNPAPLPEGSFGQQYEDLIPPDATVDEYDAKRFSLITGLVHSIDDSPLSDVSVMLHSHPEYGTVLTDAQGRFSLPVEGGTTLTVVYEKNGFITSHRKVYVPWNEIAFAETLQMIAQDPIATTVTFDGNPDTVVTHQSTRVTDEFGSRSATMVFTGDNHAYLVDENGNDVQELTTITTRATEYTTPESMPAVLPPTSAYTYCAELSVDGAQRVRFEKPVTMWVDNFLGFDVGMAVPVGYFDRDRGVWVPEKNGRVVKLLDTNADGIADALDSDGDDQPDDLNGNGIFADEVKGLEDQQKYPPGSTFWRVAVDHFSPYDINWAWQTIASLSPLIPAGSESSISPNPDGMPTSDTAAPEESIKLPDNIKCLNSYVENRSRIFHEDIPIPGTDTTLHYASDRVNGFHYGITVPASGETVPDGLKRIIVKAGIAGRTFEKILDPLPNQKTEFVWDGLDSLGRKVKSVTTAKVNIGFVYDAVYTVPFDDLLMAFAIVGQDITSILTRQAVTFWKRSDLLVSIPPNKTHGTLAEGWTLSSHHQVTPMNPSELHKGDGTIIKNNIRIIKTVAGTGESDFSGDGGPATDARLSGTSDVAVDSSGNIYIADRSNHRIRKVDMNGIITTIAGSGESGNYAGGFSGDGGPATDAKLNIPYGVAVDNAGNIYIADSLNHRIRKVDRNGVITTIAGSGETGLGAGGFSGDGGLATDAKLYRPSGVAVDNAGNIYIADSFNNRIRKVDTSGIITTVAGCQFWGFGGDGGPATDVRARLYNPTGVEVDNAGNIYIADTRNNRIRMVDNSGIITTVAGNGVGWYSGDGGPATDTSLYYPTDVAVDSSGNIYIADRNNNRIRMVDNSGIITTVAGNGTCCVFDGDGGPAVNASFYSEGVAVSSTRNIYISNSHRILEVELPSIFEISSVAGDIPFAEENGLGHIMSSIGLHKTTIDLDTETVLREFGYDENNNLVSITDQYGNQTTINRDGSGVPTSITSPDGLTTQLTIDSANHLTRITYPDGSFYSFEYTPGGLMTAKIEPEGNRFEHVFDSNGKLTDASDEVGGHWQYSRTTAANGDIMTNMLTGEGNLTSYLDRTYSTGAYTSTITGPTGAETFFSESGDGLTVNKSLPCGMNLEFKYDLDSEYKFKFVKEMTEITPSGLERVTLKDKTYQDTDSDDIPDLITETVTVNSKPTTLENNVLQSQKTVTSPEGRTVTMLYDPSTLATESVSVPGLFDTLYDYDSKGRLISVDTDTRGLDFTYNSQGFLENFTDAENHTTSYIYDAVGRVKQINRPDTTSLWFTYDKNGNMTVLTNPSTIDHGFGYNKVNLNSSYQTPLSLSYTYVYDKDRRLKQTNFPSGNQINNIYANGRLEQIQTPEGNIDFTYLCSTKVGSITKGSETITYDYDGKLVTSETLTGTLNQSLGYTYNDDFNLTSLNYSGGTESYTYDNEGLLTGAGNFTISRNAGNGLPEAVTGGALSLSRTFNGYGEIDAQDYSIGGQYLTSWSLTRNNNGRITNKSETVDGISSDYIYTYDPMGRLLTVTKDSTLVEEYQYDANGTRIYEMNSLRGISGRNFSYDNEDHLLTAGSAVYSYNLDGFLTAKTDGSDVTTYDYSSRGELLTVTLPDGRIIEYVYDPLGRRIAKKVDGVITEKYLWQGLTRLLAVYDGSDNLLMRFEYADGRMPVAMTKGGVTYYLTYDQVGSLRVVADASGNVVKKIDYDSFGNIIDDTNPTFEMPFGFAGGLNDQDTGLVRFGYRDYDPDTGRWTAKDPILFVGGDTNLYGYSLNDPVNRIDPEGAFGVFGAVVGGISGAIGGFTSGLISGNGSLVAAIAGGAAGGIVGAAVGSINIFGSSAAGQAIGSVVGGIIGGGVGGAASYAVDNCGEFSWNAVGRGALTGGAAATIAAPGVALSYIGSGGSATATVLMGASGGIMGDAAVATGVAIYNNLP
jgi:RHS repeat-associated protein